MSQIANGVQNRPLNVPLNVPEPGPQQPAAQPAVNNVDEANARALSHLSGKERAAAEIFLKGTSVQEAAKHTKWSLATKIVTGIFTFGIAPAIMCRKEANREKQLAADSVNLKDALNILEKNPTQRRTACTIDGKSFRIRRNDNGTLTATINGQKIVSNYSAKAIAEKIEDDIVANTDLYGEEAALRLFYNRDELSTRKNEKGHVGQSLIEQHEAKIAKFNQAIKKAEATVKADPKTKGLIDELEKARNEVAELKGDIEKTEMRCRQTIRECDVQIENARKAQTILDQKKLGGGQDIEKRQKGIDDARNAALSKKSEAEAELQNLQTSQKQLLDEAEIRQNAALLACRENKNYKTLTNLLEAKTKYEIGYQEKRLKLQNRLNELTAMPQKTDAVKAEISILKGNLDGFSVEERDPREIDPHNPLDALDHKGISDSRHRDLCLKAIKAHLGIDGGELHSCTTRYLDRIAQFSIKGYYNSARDLLDHVLKITTTNRIAADDVLELMNLREAEPSKNEKVNVSLLRPFKNAFATATQQDVANFAADVIFSGNIIDEDKLSPEARMKKVLQNNSNVIGDLIQVEAGIDAVNLEAKALEAEEKAKKPEATEAQKLEAKALRAEADAAQFAAKTLRGSSVVSAANSVLNFFNIFGSKKEVDQKAFNGLESRAYAAEAVALRAELRLPSREALVRNLAEAEEKVRESENDPALLSDLVDARKALDDYDRTRASLPERKEATLARLAVRLARAEAQFKISQDPKDEQMIDSLQKAIEEGGADPNLGSEYDVSANQALGERLTRLEQLPENQRQSLLSGFDEEMASAFKDLVHEMSSSLVERNAVADSVSILAGIMTIEDDTLRGMIHKVNESVTQAADMVQEEMTTAILMMDQSLQDPTKAVVREMKSVLEAENLPLTQENAEALLERDPLPAAVSTSLEALKNSITGVNNRSMLTKLAGKICCNALAEYGRLAENAAIKEKALNDANSAIQTAKDRKMECRNQKLKYIADVMSTNDALEAKNTEYADAQEVAGQADTAAKLAEDHALNLENEAKSLSQGVIGEALSLERELLQAEARLNAGGVVLEEAGALRTQIDTLRNQLTEAQKKCESGALAQARSALQNADSARNEADTARAKADEAGKKAEQIRNEVTSLRQKLENDKAAFLEANNGIIDAETALAQAEAAKTRAEYELGIARREADTALGIQQEAAPEDADADPGKQPLPDPNTDRLGYLRAVDLSTLVQAAGTDFSSDGVGKFVKFVIQDYFQSMPLQDKRAMISAGLRYAPPNASSMQKLGAMLKGAGPVLQKVFQGLDGPGLPMDLRIACQDMKSRLAPIPPDIVEATLLDMVNSSNGSIRNIKVLASLGSASVGQAFRCELTDKNGATRQCVVKILRPDAANRVKREQPIFERAAQKVPGMLGTFQGQLEGIMEELDFTIEVRNAKTGALYNKPYNGENRSIQSVTVVEDIAPKSTSMIMEQAPGTTIDAFLRNVQEEIETMGRNLGHQVVYDESGKISKVSYELPTSRLNELDPVKARLQTLYDEARTRHAQLTALADVWVTEGMFGEKGFFHGDLHTGNIMSDGKKLTVIDFGNATSLASEQQSAIMTMVVATTTRQSSKFLEAFRVMLPENAQAVFDEKKAQILESVRVIMQKGDLSDTGGRIAAILSEIQRNGVEIPHAIFNFSNSQIRLQNSINEMISLMKNIEKELRAIDTIRSQNFTGNQPLPVTSRIEETVLAAMADEAHSHESVMSYIAQTRADLQDPGSELNQEQESSVKQAFSFANYIIDFKAGNIDGDPDLSALWEQNKEALENTASPEHDNAVKLLIDALRDKSLKLLDALEQEEIKDHSRRNNPSTFLDVMSDVVDANKRSAIKKLGFMSSLKYTLFDKI